MEDKGQNSRETMPLGQFMAQAGTLERYSDWMKVDQTMIDAFADATLDHQFIHIDRQRAAAQTPFGGTIAHGFLSLSLLTHLIHQAMPAIEEAVMGINYGFDKIRFINTVASGSYIRGKFVLADSQMRNPQEVLNQFDATIEIQGQDKPALVAQWLSLAIINTQNSEEPQT